MPTFNRPNVTLVDTKGRGVDRVTETGLVFDGVEYEVDCIIFATGFEVGTAYTRRAGYEIYGRGGSDADRVLEQTGPGRCMASTAMVFRTAFTSASCRTR